ncbi:HD-GYP domain-containing protein [Desulfopila aestuarii]|uniref:HD-GYP domain, c-di-GMP phosphodiesterase class II (Or its inactivated variant) n=1 Tax=Desulfopila aestuarii DSM 18488 TaxID=1121416 RepID=A0A1M7Y8S6_9BACT|nr:HD-GYP domain-containing protein [Desulfopila aestuarii]SHO48981.1 HD-GYP domain, c-di-GMP phosphodiesterase class II (or its inactivated variant) [Desulfopila aestuarii DSM 18488]
MGTLGLRSNIQSQKTVSSNHSSENGSSGHHSILSSKTYSQALVQRLTECIAGYKAYERTGTAPLLYIAAWKEGSKNIWYEYASKKFTDFLDCELHQIPSFLRGSLIDRRTYREQKNELTGSKEIKSRNETSESWRELREEGKSSGVVEAFYKVRTKHGEAVWIKDHATVELHQADNICLSLGFLTIVSKEMESEEILQQHHDLLEAIVQGRTAELTKLNKKLRKEVEERKLIEEELSNSNTRLQGNLEEIVQAMSLTLEERDPYTVGHQRRTTVLAMAIAEKMNLSQDEKKGLQLASLIHDMGKISIPGEILSKPGPLNDVELLLIKRHPKVAYDILKQIDFPWPVDKIVLQHHEKYDGSGYPQKLAGENILLEARILCVADVVETIGSHRPYRPSMGNEAALQEIRDNRGILYDPQVVDACISIFEDKNFLATSDF